MSAEVMTEIHKVLQKYTNLSVKITMSSNEDTRYTTISFKESNCLKKTEKKKKRKSPSQVKQDLKRQESFLARMASSGDQDSAAAILLLPTNVMLISPLNISTKHYPIENIRSYSKP